MIFALPSADPAAVSPTWTVSSGAVVIHGGSGQSCATATLCVATDNLGDAGRRIELTVTRQPWWCLPPWSPILPESSVQLL
jgi:hypothetical protein